VVANAEIDVAKRKMSTFSLWLGSPLPLFALQSSLSFAAARSRRGGDEASSSSRLFVAAREQERGAAADFELLRRGGVLVCDYSSADIPDEAERLAGLLGDSRYGSVPLLADAFRYSRFARCADGVEAWVDADSVCLPRGPGMRDLPAAFVASEPARLAAPFRRLGLSDEHVGPFAGTAAELPPWLRAAREPRLATNSHLRLPPDLGQELLSRLLRRRPATVTSDAGMTELRRLVSERSLWHLVRPARDFNPIPSWRPDLFADALAGGAATLPLLSSGARCLHVFSAARRRLPPLDFSTLLLPCEQSR
jgi:hypothetical protein